jgi:hypothetical protein
LDFEPLCNRLTANGIQTVDLNIGNYVSLNNEITIKDIAEGLDRAFRNNPRLNQDQEFDAIVHSTGMLLIRSWLTNYGAAVGSNDRLRRLKHLIGLAPATWGSPQAHKGRTWIGALVKGSKEPGPDSLTQETRFLTDWNSEAALPGISLISIYSARHLIMIRNEIRPMYACLLEIPHIRGFRVSRTILERTERYDGQGAA